MKTLTILKRLTLFCGLASVTAMIFFGVLCLFLASILPRRIPIRNEPFDREVWLRNSESANGDPKNPRGLMVKDLTFRHLKTGMSREAVIAVLGKADDSRPDIETYYTGGRSGGFILAGYDYLTCYFDANNRLTKTQIWQVD